MAKKKYLKGPHWFLEAYLAFHCESMIDNDWQSGSFISCSASLLYLICYFLAYMLLSTSNAYWNDKCNIGYYHKQASLHHWMFYLAPLLKYKKHTSVGLDTSNMGLIYHHCFYLSSWHISVFVGENNCFWKTKPGMMTWENANGKPASKDKRNAVVPTTSQQLRQKLTETSNKQFVVSEGIILSNIQHVNSTQTFLLPVT